MTYTHSITSLYMRCSAGDNSTNNFRGSINCCSDTIFTLHSFPTLGNRFTDFWEPKISAV